MNMPVLQSPGEKDLVAQTELVEFRNSPIHGIGGFARRTLSAGMRIIEYVGERIDKQESLRRCEANNEYIFTLDEQHDIDGNVDWNPARFINHSCAANCDAEYLDGRIWIVTRCPILAGAEITFNYGYDLEEYKEYRCHCGSDNCVGYIVAEDFHEHVRRQAELGNDSVKAVNT